MFKEMLAALLTITIGWAIFFGIEVVVNGEVYFIEISSRDRSAISVDN